MSHYLEVKAYRNLYVASTHKGIVNGDEDEHGSEDPPEEGHLVFSILSNLMDFKLLYLHLTPFGWSPPLAWLLFRRPE